jgi:hypothetical protein
MPIPVCLMGMPFGKRAYPDRDEYDSWSDRMRCPLGQGLSTHVLAPADQDAGALIILALIEFGATPAPGGHRAALVRWRKLIQIPAAA